MKLIIIVILFTASSTCINSLDLVRCGWPMTLTSSIAFQIPTGSITGGYSDYNLTEYRFNWIACMCSTIVRNTENYECRSGNTIDRTSLILNDGNLNFDVGRIICKTTNGEIPVVPAQGYFSFSCQETQTVQPRLVHDEVNKYTVIKPVSFYRSRLSDRNSSEWNRLLHSGPGFRFKFDDNDKLSKLHFRAYWRECSSIVIIGREGQGVKLQQQEKDFSRLLAKILEFKNDEDISSLEITQSNLTILPNTICQIEYLQRFAVVGNQIQELPTCLHNMLKLKFLDFSFNALKSINEITFGSRWYATYLDLSFNQIAYIKDNAFSQLGGLVYLSLRNNMLTKVNFHFSSRDNKGLPILQLDLSHNSIRYLPSSISKLTRIMTLLFQHNEIETIDFSIPSSLGLLDLSYNHLEFIDSRIFKDATNLLTLNLKNNRLKTFQISWDILPGTGWDFMEIINLKNNLIENLDESLFTRTPKTLDISYNRLKVIDLNILQEAKYLETLRLDYNNITEIRDGILNGTHDITILPKVNYMNISHNQLKVAPLSLIFLNVQIIDFSHNEIERCTWSNMPNAHILKNIDQKIIGSCIENYNHKRDALRKLVLLDHNRIKSLKDVFGRTSIMVHRYATLLCHVHLPYNPFHCDCKAYPYLQAIHDFLTQTGRNEADDTKNVIISKDQAHKIFYWNYDQYSCDTPTGMKSHSLLDYDLLAELSCNLLPQEDCQILFKPSVPVLIVNCSKLNLNKLPHFDATFSIKLNTSATKHHVPEGINVNIHLNQNNISQISLDQSENLLITEMLERSIKAHVNVLDLSYSNIAHIDVEFLLYLSKNLPYLTHLYLNGNKLTQLPLDEHTVSLQKGSDTRVPFWERLAELHLYNNTWDCSCSAMWMTKLLNRLIARKTLVRPDEILCATPERNRGRIVYMLEDQSLCEDTKLAFYAEQHFVLNMIIALFVLWYTWKFFHKDTIRQVTRDAIVNDDDITGMVFDAFVSYCEHDSAWVEQKLIPCLQEHDPPYKICKHKLHFVPGNAVQENEFNAIKHSRRTIIVMSKEYLGREHCRYEFTTAYNYWITEKEHPRLVVVKYQDVENRNQYETCHAYFKKFTYLTKDENTFDRLLAFMPRRSLQQYGPEVDNDAARLFMWGEDQNSELNEDQEEPEASQDQHVADELM